MEPSCPLGQCELKQARLQPASGSSPCDIRRCLTCNHIQTGAFFGAQQPTQVSLPHTIMLEPPAQQRMSSTWSNAESAESSMWERYRILSKSALMDIAMISPHTGRQRPVAGHFNGPGHSLDHLRVAVLEVMGRFYENLRMRRGQCKQVWTKNSCPYIVGFLYLEPKPHPQ